MPEVIYENQDVTFNCSAGVGVVNITWWLDGSLLQAGVGGQLVGMVTLSWNGACLTCHVEKSAGGAANASHILRVASKLVGEEGEREDGGREGSIDHWMERKRESSSPTW